MDELKCNKCGDTLESAKDGVLFSVCGNIMANSKEMQGGIIGANIAEGLYIDEWEQKRDGLVATSNDMTLRIHKLVYCKECLCFAINITTS